MVRFSTYHGWHVPEPGDPRYNVTINRLINAIDNEVLLRSPRGARPSPDGRGRWHLATDEDPPTLAYEMESEWVGIGGNYELPDSVTHADIQEVIDEPWEFVNGIIGDIDGQATNALEAEHAQEAENAQRLGGKAADEFTRSSQEETIERRWTFENRQTFEGRVAVVDGVINLPQYEDSDPPSSERTPGSMWFRLSDQPS